MQQTTIKDFFRTILTRVAGLEPQTIETEAEVEAATLINSIALIRCKFNMCT